MLCIHEQLQVQNKLHSPKGWMNNKLRVFNWQFTTSSQRWSVYHFISTSGLNRDFPQWVVSFHFSHELGYNELALNLSWVGKLAMEMEGRMKGPEGTVAVQTKTAMKEKTWK